MLNKNKLKIFSVLSIILMLVIIIPVELYNTDNFKFQLHENENDRLFQFDTNNYEDTIDNVEYQFLTENKEDVLLQKEQKLNQQNQAVVPKINLLNSNEEGIELKFSLSELNVENITAPTGELYQKLSILGGGRLADIGKPELPTKGIYLDVPIGVELEFQIKSSTFREENGYNIYPYQPSQIDCENNEIPFEKNLTTYQINSFYPNEIVNIMDVGIIRAHRTALIIICPVLYNPIQQKIRVYSKIVLEINYPNYEPSDLDSNNKQELGEKYDSSSFQSLFENLYLNYENPTNSIINDNDGDFNGIGADYLIITPEQFCDNLIPLVNNKENQGLITKVANFTETGSTVSEIEAYIQNAYDTWDIPPSYLLLVGDSNLLPTKYVEHLESTHSSPVTLPTDLYYATVDGDDYFPDLFYGRLPIQNDAELDIVIGKTLNWVNNYNPADAWRQRILLSAYYQTEPPPPRYFVDTSESIRSHLESKGYTCNTVYQLEDSTDPADTTAVINYINEGTFLVNHRNHGEAAGWQHPEFYTSHVSSLTNENNYTVFFSVDCETGHFDGASDCLAEAILKANNKGAVAYIGATRVTWSGFNDELNRGLITSIWPDYFSDYTNNAGHSAELGAVLNFGKFFMFDKYVLTGGVGSEGTEYPWGSVLYPQKTQNTFEMFHLFGDPQLSLIESDIPSEPYNPKPSNESVGINKNVVLGVDVFDPNGDLMNVSFYNANDDSLIGNDLDISNRKTAYTTWSGLSQDTTYSWYANVTDGIYWIQSPIWEFTTRSDIEFSKSPIIINEIDSGLIDSIELYNFGPDQDMTGWYMELYAGEDLYASYYFPIGWTFHSNYVVTIYESSGTNSDTELYTGENINMGAFRYAVGLFNKKTINQDWFQTSDFVLTPPSSVKWVNDITLITTDTEPFAYRISDIDTDHASDWTVASSGSVGSLNPGQSGVWNAPDAPTNPVPSDGATGVLTDLTLYVDVFDPDGDAMDISFYNAFNDSLIGTAYGVSSGGTASVSWLGLSGNTEYEWYAIADDGMCNTISSTWSFTTINTAPDAPTNPDPSDEATGVSTNPTLYVDVFDPDGNTMDVSFYNADGDILIGTAYGISSGGTASMSWLGLSGNTEYEWYAVASDGTDSTQSAMWTFTTGNAAPDAPTNPVPSDGATEMPTDLTLYVDVFDPDGDAMDISFYNADGDILIGTAYGISSGGTASVPWSGLSGNTEYEWYAVASDGTDSTQSATWSFTTVNAAPNAPTNPYPPDGAIGLPINPALSVDVFDPDGDAMDISFYDASDDTLIGTDVGVPSGGTASVIWLGLSEDITYQWYANVTDGIYTTQSPMWSFTVGIELYLTDLSISSDDITFSNPNPEVGETVEINATVYNIGNILGWWNTDWKYRRPIVIDNTANAQTLTNYLKVMNIPYDDEMASNFDDLRFVDSNLNELQYWIESYVPSDNADVWVNISFVPALGKTMIYMYYGNPTASSNSEFPFKFYINATLGGGYSSFDTTRNLWEKPGTGNMYAFYQPSGNAASYYWEGSTWIRDDSAVSGMPFQYALQKRYYYYDEEFGETMFITSWNGGVYQNHVKTWDGDSWVTNTTLENGLNLPQGTSSEGGRYLDYIIFKQYGLKHLICPNYNKWTWTGSQWVENASVPDFTFVGDIVTLHYKFTQSGTTKYHWFPVVINFHNTTHCKVFHFDGTQWNEIHLGKLGDLPGTASTTYFRPDMNVIDNRLTMSLSTSAVPNQFWSSNLYFADLEPTYQIGLEEDIWWNIEWKYRRPIVIDNTANAQTLTNYLKVMNIPYDDEMASNFDDLRFVDSNLNELQYWIESYVPSDNADVWVNISFVPALGKTMIYMYYGNPTASSNSEFPFKFYINATLGGGYSSFDTTRNLWEKPGTGNMYAFYQPSGNAASYYWEGSTWIRDDSAVSGMPFQYALQKRYYYYDEEFGETMFITSWNGGVYQNHVKTWDGDSWVTNTTLENGLNLPQGTSSEGGRYLDYIIFKQYGLKHLICPNYNKWTWTGSQWVENASVPDFTFVGDIVTLHYKFTQSGTTKYHWFPVVINFHNTTHCKVFHFDGTQWNEIHLGKLGDLPGTASTTYFRPDMNVIDNRLTMSLSTSAVPNQFWSSNLYFADLEPTYQIGLEEDILHIATADVSFFDGNPEAGGVMIASQNINVYGDQSTMVSINWIFTTIGLHDIYVRIENVIPLDINLSNNLAFKTITVTTVNAPPDAPTNPVPSDGATGVPTDLTLYVDVFDPDGDAMDVSFYNADGDILIGTAYGISSGGTASMSWLGLSGNTEYEWYAVASDGTDSTQSATWSFTTVNAAPDAPTNPVPSDGATGVPTDLTLYVD
ncbi:MAG: DUF2341 domain-containing protein, partial [Promethearchaeota archaeon]